MAPSLKVTVVTVAFNSESTIDHTIASVAAQTYKNIEYIVVDGGSTDRTLQILTDNHETVDKVISEPDDGIYDAMNKGVRAATGDIVALLNSDDRYADTTVVSHMVERMQSTGADLAYADVAFEQPESRGRVVRHYRSNKFHPSQIGEGQMPPHPSCFARSTLFATVGPFRTDYRIAGDFEWLLRALVTHGCTYTYVDQTVVVMSLGGTSTDGLGSLLINSKEKLRACRENDVKASWLQLARRYPARMRELIAPRLPGSQSSGSIEVLN